MLLLLLLLPLLLLPFQVGDRLLSCSAVFGDEMWHAQDLQRTRWAINNRPGKVRNLLMQ
jgi:hypothetical protein